MYPRNQRGQVGDRVNGMYDAQASGLGVVLSLTLSTGHVCKKTNRSAGAGGWFHGYVVQVLVA